MPMGAIQVKDVPEELHEALRRRAIQEGMSLADYSPIVQPEEVRSQEWFERLAAREPVNLRPGEAAEMIRAERAEREDQIAAALGLEDVDVEDEEDADDASRD